MCEISTFRPCRTADQAADVVIYRLLTYTYDVQLDHTIILSIRDVQLVKTAFTQSERTADLSSQWEQPTPKKTIGAIKINMA